MKQKSSDFALMVAVGVGFVMGKVEVLEWCNKLSNLKVEENFLTLFVEFWYVVFLFNFDNHYTS